MKKIVIEDIESGDTIRIEEQGDTIFVDVYDNLRIFIDDEEVTFQEKMS
jgi:hypothetical protein